MRTLIIISLLFGSTFSMLAQGEIDKVLRSIESNNKTIQAGKQTAASQKLESKMDSNLPDPSVSYSHQYGNKEGLGIQGELIASQSFDFPTVYAQKHKLNKTIGAGLDLQQEGLRREILLQAKEICIDLIALNKQSELLKTRLANAEKLSKMYAVKLERGDANVIETNKINLELLNVRNEYRVNESQRKAKLQELSVLNGGEAISFDATEYDNSVTLPTDYSALKQEYMDSNIQLQTLESEKLAEKQRINVAKNLNLPGLELGYRLNTATGGERFNGFLVGMSVPLFANRHNVKMMKARSLAKELQTDNAVAQESSRLSQLYEQAQTLQASVNEYSVLLKDQKTIDILNKAIEAGQISMIEYFVDASSYYQTLQNYIQIQSEYQKLLAQIYQYKL